MTTGLSIADEIIDHDREAEKAASVDLAITAGLVQTWAMTKELIFDVEQDGDLLVSVCHEPEMATQGANIEELIAMIRDLVRCGFEEADERLRWRIVQLARNSYP